MFVLLLHRISYNIYPLLCVNQSREQLKVQYYGNTSKTTLNLTWIFVQCNLTNISYSRKKVIVGMNSIYQGVQRAIKVVTWGAIKYSGIR